MKVELQRADWQEVLTSSINMLKTAMAQVAIYSQQVAVAEKKMKEFPEPEKKIPTGVK